MAPPPETFIIAFLAAFLTAHNTTFNVSTWMIGRFILFAPQAKVEIKGNSFQLQALSKALIGYHENDFGLVFDARGQREIGRPLIDQTVGRLGEADLTRLRRSSDVEVRVITDDEHIMRLPWILMADKKIFLSNEGWSISFSSRREAVSAELPPSPKMLFAAPQTTGESGLSD
jgi:hypothetical protein